MEPGFLLTLPHPFAVGSGGGWAIGLVLNLGRAAEPSHRDNRGIGVRGSPHGSQARLWLTASMLWPSGSSTNAP
jgi:hypothetical protein